MTEGMDELVTLSTRYQVEIINGIAMIANDGSVTATVSGNGVRTELDASDVKGCTICGVASESRRGAMYQRRLR